MRKSIYAVACVLSIASTSAFAASPKSFAKLDSGVTEDGKSYTAYSVTCSNKEQAMLTYWDATREYCLGEMGTEVCSKKKIKVAKTACK